MSHAIPYAVFKNIFRGKDDSGKSIVVPGGGDEHIHYSSDSWATLQLCDKCEKLLNKHYESYSIKVLRGAIGQFKKHSIGVTFSKIDTSKLINFLLPYFGGQLILDIILTQKFIYQNLGTNKLVKCF